MPNAEKDPCSRCGGEGYLPQYSHVEGGVCFRCRGSRVEPEGRRRSRRSKSRPKRLSDEARGFLAGLVVGCSSAPWDEDKPLAELLAAGLVAPITVRNKAGEKCSEYFATERGHASYQKAVEAGLIKARPGEWVQ